MGEDKYILYIGNRNYSSWSLAAWLTLKTAKINFQEILLPLGIKGSRKAIKQYSPSGLVPCLHHQNNIIWDSLAIAEYINELHPQAELYPQDFSQRSLARSIIYELHSGFQALKRFLPLNIKRIATEVEIPEDARWNIVRLSEIISETKIKYGVQGDYLFNTWSMADIFYAQMMLRFKSYNIQTNETVKSYIENIVQHPLVEKWVKAAHQEEMSIPAIDSLNQ
jgi:glutathione S-transferase